MKKKIFVDIETTGLDCNVHSVVQIAGVIEVSGVEAERFNVFLRPLEGRMVNPRALEVCGVSLADIRGYPPAEEGYREILGIFEKYIDRYDKADKFIWVGQNPRFDYGFLDSLFGHFKNPYLYAFVNYHLIDVSAVVMAVCDYKGITIDNLRLETICKALDVGLTAHNALSDALAVREVYGSVFKLL